MIKKLFWVGVILLLLVCTIWGYFLYKQITTIHKLSKSTDSPKTTVLASTVPTVVLPILPKVTNLAFEQCLKKYVSSTPYDDYYAGEIEVYFSTTTDESKINSTLKELGFSVVIDDRENRSGSGWFYKPEKGFTTTSWSEETANRKDIENAAIIKQKPSYWFHKLEIRNYPDIRNYDNAHTAIWAEVSPAISIANFKNMLKDFGLIAIKLFPPDSVYRTLIVKTNEEAEWVCYLKTFHPDIIVDASTKGIVRLD